MDDALIAGTAVVVGMAMIVLSPIYIARCLQLYPPNVPRLWMYFGGLWLLNAAIGFFVLVAGVGIAFLHMDPEKKVLMNIIFSLVAIATMAVICGGFYCLEKAKEPPREEERGV